ncbi:MAG TPA: glycoside hydrolase domain-containing protein [Longimicrobiaceae bacterium]|nr:glycoside hydrolase domain-containing protein [Longimicrobiaceae bacterium]
MIHSIGGKGRRPRWAALVLIGMIGGCAGVTSTIAPDVPVYPGFDTSIYPGDGAMRTWRAESPYRWVGYYLPAPCRRDNSWVGKRATLERMGWGIALLYVGQQQWDGTPDPDPGLSPESILCSRTLLTAEQGRRDARDAADRAAAEGFPPGSHIFLDIERTERIGPEMANYYQAWLRGIVQDGRYRPATYAHRINAAALYMLAQGAFALDKASLEPPFWVAGTGGFTLSSHPTRSGAPYADLWQGALDVQREWGGVRLLIDENTATRPNPSAP